MNTHVWILLFIAAFAICYSDAFNIEIAPVARRSFKRGTGQNSDKSDNDGQIFFGQTFSGNVIQLYREKYVTFMVSAPGELTEEEIELTRGGRRVGSSLRSGSAGSVNTSGVLYMCDMPTRSFALNENNTNGLMFNCTGKNPFKRKLLEQDYGRHDTVGISLTADPRANQSARVHLPSEVMLACAHLRSYNCSNTLNAEGTCYLSKVSQGRGDAGNLEAQWKKKTPCVSECTKKMIDLIFLIDGSQSITNTSFELIKDWIIDIASGFNISDDVHVGVVQFSHYYSNRALSKQPYMRTQIVLGQFKNMANFRTAVRRIKYHGYTTYTAHAIEKVVRYDFDGRRSRYPTASRILILLTDGESSDHDYLNEAVNIARNHRVVSFAVGVGQYNVNELKLIAGTDKRVVTVSTFTELQQIVQQMQRGIQSIEGSSTSTANNGLNQCQAGISSGISKAFK